LGGKLREEGGKLLRCNDGGVGEKFEFLEAVSRDLEQTDDAV